MTGWLAAQGETARTRVTRPESCAARSGPDGRSTPSQVSPTSCAPRRQHDMLVVRGIGYVLVSGQPQLGDPCDLAPLSAKGASRAYDSSSDDWIVRSVAYNVISLPARMLPAPAKPKGEWSGENGPQAHGASTKEGLMAEPAQTRGRDASLSARRLVRRDMYVAPRWSASKNRR